MYYYYVGILDHFDGLIPLKKYVDLLKIQEKKKCFDSHWRLDTFKQTIEEMLFCTYMQCSYWEGDAWIYVGALPFPEELQTKFYLILKQDNNGSTFVCSPYSLNYLNTTCEKIGQRENNFENNREALINTERLLKIYFDDKKDNKKKINN